MLIISGNGKECALGFISSGFENVENGRLFFCLNHGDIHVLNEIKKENYNDYLSYVFKTFSSVVGSDSFSCNEESNNKGESDILGRIDPKISGHIRRRFLRRKFFVKM